MDREAILKEAATRIRRHLGPEYQLILFGSWARGDAQDRSDIDIGILGPTPVEDTLLLVITTDIEGIPTLRKIDVVDLMTVSERFRTKATREGVPLV